MIVIDSENGQQVCVEVRSREVVLWASTTVQIFINLDDARELRRLLDQLG